MLVGSYFSWQFIPKKWCCIGEYLPLYVTCSILGISRSTESADRRCWVGICIEIKSLGYLGARLFKHLKVINTILKGILSFTESQ